MTVTEEINQFIEENTKDDFGSILGYVRTCDALNIALTRLKSAEARAAQAEQAAKDLHDRTRKAELERDEQKEAARLSFNHRKQAEARAAYEELRAKSWRDSAMTLADQRDAAYKRNAELEDIDSRIAAAVAFERERCIETALDCFFDLTDTSIMSAPEVIKRTRHGIAAAIRARRQGEEGAVWKN